MYAPLCALVARVQGGGTPSRAISEYWRGPIPWASVKDLSKQKFEIHETVEHISLKGLASSSATLIPAGIPIISTRMAVGKAVIPTVDIAINQDLKALHPAPHVDARYLTHSLQFIESKVDAVSVGSTVRGISVDQLMKFRVFAPQLSEQRRIAEILDTLDDQIRATEQVVAKLRLTKIGLINDLLTRGIGSNGTIRAMADTKEGKVTSLGFIPGSWEVQQCAELCREITVGIVIRPTQYYKPSGVPMLRSANVRADGLVLSDLVYMSPEDHAAMSKSAVGPGDVVTVRTGYPGTTAVVDDNLPAANCIDIIVSRPGPRILPEYLALWVNSEFGKGQVLRNQGGLAQQHFNVSEMKSLRVALPSVAEQRQIVEKLGQFDRRLSVEIGQITKLHSLKKGLMADLLTGGVPVEVEAAS
ncbi:restriction endonuclease subunit S [Rhodococcus opacus]|uniref:restriction endonuclease subunit S n=1 Tax=Rhodococcus opacus TaxID=37919 RepID=UPI0034D156B1